MRAFAIPISRYRRAGADPPWFDPRRYHGVAMEGYFWRFTHAASGRVAIVMCGVNRSSAGERWAFVGLAVHPGGFFRWAALQDATADAGGYGVRAGAAFSAGPGPRGARSRAGLPARRRAARARWHGRSAPTAGSAARTRCRG